MSNANEIKQHLKAVEQTRKITNAMYLLSTSRMKKAMSSIDFNLFYLQRLRTTIKDILSKTKNNNLTNKFIEEQAMGSAVFVVVTSDKGLCGGYNSGVVNLALEKMKEHKKEGYFAKVRRELKKVVWPSFSSVAKYSLAVIIFCLLFCGFFIGVDALASLVKGLFS